MNAKKRSGKSRSLVERLRATGKEPTGQAGFTPRQRWLVLGLVNTLQPVSSKALKQALGDVSSDEELKQILHSLRSDRLVELIGRTLLVTTSTGRQLFGIGKLGVARDVNRMLFLVERQPGGEENR